jgi:hypothetical protein
MLGLGLKLGKNIEKPSTQPYVSPLDAIMSKVWTSYGLTRHFEAVSESLRVRESAGSVETNIGTLSNGYFDSVSFSSFVGSNSGFCSRVYDQKASNVNSDLPQSTTTSQPQVILTSNIDSKPALRFSNTRFATSLVTATPTAIGTGDFELWVVCYPTSSTGTRCVGFLAGAIYFYSSTGVASGGAGKPGFYNVSGYNHFGGNVSANAKHILRFYRVSGRLYCDVDGATMPSNFASTDNLVKAANYSWGETGGEQFAGDMSDFIIIRGSLTSSERDALKTHFSTIYNIPVS